MSTSHLPSPPSDLFALDFLAFNADLDPTSPQIANMNPSEHPEHQSYPSSSLPSRNSGQHGSTVAEAGPSNYLASQSYASSTGGFGSNANTPGNVANTPSMVPSIGTPNLVGTPHIPSNASHASAESRRGSIDEPKRGGSLRGRPRAKGKTAVTGARTSLGGVGSGSTPIIEDSMDLDQVFNAMASSSGGGLEASQGMTNQLGGTDGMDAFAGSAFGPNGSYASAQAMLQQVSSAGLRCQKRQSVLINSAGELPCAVSSDSGSFERSVAVRGAVEPFYGALARDAASGHALGVRAAGPRPGGGQTMGSDSQWLGRLHHAWLVRTDECHGSCSPVSRP